MKNLLFILSLTLLACQPKGTERSAMEITQESTAISVKGQLPAPAIPLPPDPPASLKNQVEPIKPEPLDNQVPKINTAPKKKPESPGPIQEPEPTEPVLPAELPQTTPGPEPTPGSPSEPEAEPQEPSPVLVPVATKPDYSTWDDLLKKYVSSSGKVNYIGFKKDKASLLQFLNILEKTPPQDNWSRSEKMAFWINAYNAFTIKLIIDYYPVNSIRDIHNGKPWDVKWIKIGEKDYSLNNIENDILRPIYKDPRIHFAVNCAAKSCPPLLNRAWTASNLESNFEKQTKAFINNPAFNTIGAKQVSVSKIFEWYATDFGNLISYLNKYATNPINSKASISYKPYDWALNN